MPPLSTDCRDNKDLKLLSATLHSDIMSRGVMEPRPRKELFPATPATGCRSRLVQDCLSCLVLLLFTFVFTFWLGEKGKRWSTWMCSGTDWTKSKEAYDQKFLSNQFIYKISSFGWLFMRLQILGVLSPAPSCRLLLCLLRKLGTKQLRLC